MNYPFDFISEFNFVNDEISPCDVIIIPGGSHTQLIEKAVELLNQDMAKYILISGGANSNLKEHSTEAQYFRSLALKMGVPDEKILCADNGYSIYENTIFAYDMLKNLNIKFESIILVCKAYQSRRVLFAHQNIFPPNVKFLVSSVTDNRGITKENWYTKPEHISFVMSEVVKLGDYFKNSILLMYESRS